MSEPRRRFFSGDSLQQALVQAANYYQLDPEEIAYRSVEKRHGFLKTRRKVVIEVNPDAPRRDRTAPPPPATAPAATPVAQELSEAPAPALSTPTNHHRPAAAERPAGADGPGRPPRGNRDRPDRPDRRERRGDRPDRRREGHDSGRRGERDAPRRADEPRRPSAPRPPREEVAEAGEGGLVSLPEAPRRPSERYPEATGPQAEAAAKGVELLLRIAGLDLKPRILQGEDRLEVDLSGEDVDWCFADDGEFVLAMEHLLPRVIRSLSGEAVLVRVDCDNFQEIREERLRSLAQQVAEEVRRRGKPRTLEPMNPADRRIVHVTLADDPGVVTESEGDGYFKRITVRPV